MNGRILITGGSGFIGTHLVDLLSSSGAVVLNVDKEPPRKPSHHEWWFDCDILDLDSLREAFEAHEPSAVVHLAARTDTEGQTLHDYRDNTEGTANLLRVIGENPCVRRVIITSTQFVCRPGALPESDEDFRPHTVYGESKVVTEKLTRASNLGAAWTIIRPTNIWGPWHPRYPHEFWRVLHRGLYVHPAGPQPIRCYGYVENVTHQIRQMLEAPEEKVGGRTFYVGDPPAPLSEWVGAFSRALTGRDVKVVPRPVVRAIACVGDILGFAGVKFPLTTSRFRSMTQDYPTPMQKTFDALGPPRYSVEEGVERTVEWLSEEGFLGADDQEGER